MPTIMTHAVVGLGLGRMAAAKPMPRRFWIAAALLSAMPDADVIGFGLGIRYGDPLGHRGLTHGVPFAIVVGVAAAWLLCRGARSLGGMSRLRLAVFLALVIASHGALDAFTDGGHGIGFLVPFENARYFWPVQPIEVAPIGIAAFFSEWGLSVMWSEIRWIWLPLAALVAVVEVVRRLRPSTTATPP